MSRIVLALALVMAPSLAVAQASPGQDSDTVRSNRIAAETAPGVAAANRAVAGRLPPTGVVPPLDRAAYAEDMRSYDAAMRARRQTIRRDRAYHDRQQRAYAMAMADWRAQVAACHHGHTRACNAPTPRPGDYM